MSEGPTRRELVAAFVPQSPFAQHLGLRIDVLEPDVAELVLPFADSLPTMGDVVHGGAIATLIDTAGMAAAWSDDARPKAAAGSTVSLSVDYVAAARGCDLRARAEVVRRGGQLCFVDITVRAEDTGDVVAKGMLCHRYG